jgi:hypothetical protein
MSAQWIDTLASSLVTVLVLAMLYGMLWENLK